MAVPVHVLPASTHVTLEFVNHVTIQKNEKRTQHDVVVVVSRLKYGHKPLVYTLRRLAIVGGNDTCVADDDNRRNHDLGPGREATSSSAARGIASSSILRKGNLQSTGAASGVRIDVGGLSCPIVISSS